MAKGGWKNWKGPQLLKAVNGASREAVQKTCYVILEAARQQVPHDEGTLMLSGMVLMAPDGSPQGVICFGGGLGTGHPIVPYALRWHENSASFQKGRKRFYLRDPYNQLISPTLTKALQIELGGVLK
ncbi:MAG: hypothetical protein WC260_03820 [Candidatus Pacearchaeota archaeon]